MAYKLSCVLRGHEMDVRGICKSVHPPGGLISVSRDRSVRVWKKDEDTSEFIEGHRFSGHEGFVAAVCTMPESEKYPYGLIITGGHDNLILVWSIESLKPLQTLSGHEGAVCALAAGNYGTILSGSWDKTAKVWLGEKCVMTLQGHEQAVWDVALIAKQGLMLTASADRTVKLWKAGVCVKTFSGHTDCVRSLAILSSTEFLSSSNDNTVRKWSTSGECLKIHEGHTNFVYSLAVFPNDSGNFVSTSEDRTIRIWKGGECYQTITLPTQSVWCSVCLENGDIAVGSSDGIIRVFTSNPERMATEVILKQFEEEVASHAVPAQVSSDGKLGDIKIEDLPGPEALLRPGKSSGQNLLIKKGGAIEVHQWNDTEGKWEKVGEVVGAGGTSNGTSQKSGKTTYNGKEYDYVFDVDIQEGKPPLKLPYNLTDEPWFAAQQFLERNNLSQLFLDQVANFITTNTKSISIGSETRSGYIDPYTGGSRYVPGPETLNQGISSPRPGADPFTGQASYQPRNTPMSVESTTPPERTNKNIGTYFPEKVYLSFDQVKIDSLMGRLQEFNAKVDEAKKLTSEDILEVQNVLSISMDKTKSKTPLTQKQIKILTTLIHWPSDICYPGLDILRLLIRNLETSKNFIDNGEETIKYLIMVVSTEKEANQDITIGIVYRIFSNFFSQDRGVNIVLEQQNLIIQSIKDNCKNSNKAVQIAACTVLINFSVALKNRNDSEARIQCLNTLNLIMHSLVDNEAKFRSLVALGTLIWGDADCLSQAKRMNFLNLIKPFSSISNPQKVGECASQLMEALK